MAVLSPILTVVIAAAAVLLSLPAMFLFLAWHTHRQQASWKKEHDRAVESIEKEKRRSSREPKAVPPPPPSLPHNKNNNRQPMQTQKQQGGGEARGAQSAVQRRPSATLPPRPTATTTPPPTTTRKVDKPRGSRDTTPQFNGFQFHLEGVLPGWGQQVRSPSPPQNEPRAVDG